MPHFAIKNLHPPFSSHGCTQTNREQLDIEVGLRILVEIHPICEKLPLTTNKKIHSFLTYIILEWMVLVTSNSGITSSINQPSNLNMHMAHKRLGYQSSTEYITTDPGDEHIKITT